LDDFAHGSFILHGERGGVFGFLSAFQCPSWEDIESRLLEVAGLREFKSSGDISRFQAVIASCADKIQGQPLDLAPVCPFCRSRSVDYCDSKPLDAGEIPLVTFTEFQSLSNSAKRGKLTELWNR
jgi:hypothetical protein